eukprot:2989809-Amphidinium_carterae.1
MLQGWCQGERHEQTMLASSCSKRCRTSDIKPCSAHCTDSRLALTFRFFRPRALFNMQTAWDVESDWKQISGSSSDSQSETWQMMEAWEGPKLGNTQYLDATLLLS